MDVLEIINELQRKHKYVYFIVNDNGDVFYIPDHHKYLDLRTAPKQKIGNSSLLSVGNLYLYKQLIIKQKQVMENAAFKKGDKVIRNVVGSSMGRPGEVISVSKENGIEVTWGESGVTSKKVDPKKLALQKGNESKIKSYLAARNGKPESGKGKPESGKGKPESGKGKPESEKGKPESGKGKPESGKGKPESGKGKPESEKGKPESEKGAKTVVKTVAISIEKPSQVDSSKSGKVNRPKVTQEPSAKKTDSLPELLLDFCKGDLKDKAKAVKKFYLLYKVKVEDRDNLLTKAEQLTKKR